MFERLSTWEAAYRYKLGAALKMEHTVLEILDSAVEEAQAEPVETLFAQHRSESEGHVRNLEQAFRQMGWEPSKSPCPAIDCLQAEGQANAKKSDPRIVDTILLQSAVEVEHYEIGVYQNLIDAARAAGRKDSAELLTRNLDSERRALKLARDAHQKVAAALQPPTGVLGRLKSAAGM